MRYANLLLIAALLAVPAGCGLTKKMVNNRDDGTLKVNRDVRVYNFGKDGQLIIVEVMSNGRLEQDKGDSGQHSELKMDPTKLKK